MMVLDSSTLILLAKTGILEVVAEEMECVITGTVEKESTVKKSYDAKLIERMIVEKRISVEDDPDEDTLNRLKKDFNIHRGEASSIGIYLKRNADILATDDGLTLRTCNILGINCTTSIALLIRLKEKSLLSREHALSKLEKLAKYGWYRKRIIEDAERRIKGDCDG